MDKENYLRLQAAYYDSFQKLLKKPSVHIPLENFQIDEQIAMGPEWLIFYISTKDFVRILVNEINEFSFHLISLDSWSHVITACSEEEKLDVIYEIIDPIAAYVFGYPYAIKQRLIFSACMVIHHTLNLFDEKYKDSDVKEEKINIHTLYSLKKKVEKNGINFCNCSKLIDALRGIDNKDFHTETKNFRNRFQHRIPPNIEVGLTSFLTRIEEAGSVSYGIGGEKPVELRKVLKFFYVQHVICRNVFNIFLELLMELFDVWKQKRPIKQESFGSPQHNL